MPIHCYLQGKLVSMGWNKYGQCGCNPLTAERLWTPHLVDTCSNVAALACGWSHSIFLSDGAAYGFGWNGYFQLGNGTNEDSWEPVRVKGCKHVKIKSVACGTWHTVLLSGQGDVYCCGWGIHFQLGQVDDQAKAVATYAPVGCKVRSISCGNRHTSLLTQEGRIATFGTYSQAIALLRRFSLKA